MCGYACYNYKKWGLFMFIEEKLETKVLDSYDVVVCGGGFGGIFASLAAAMTDDLSRLDVAELQRVLVENKVVLHESDL